MNTVRRQLALTVHSVSGPVTGLAFSPDGSKLYAGYDGGPVRVWSIATAYPPEMRERLTRLQREHPVIADVWRLIKNDDTLHEAQRAAMLTLCPWRLDSDQELRARLWGPLIYPPDSTFERKLLLQRAESVLDALPWSTEAWTILGAAQYRNGLLAEAARNLERASAVACDDPRADAFLSMTHYALGQSGRASETLSRARLLLGDAELVPQHDGRAIVAEAEALFAGAKLR